MRRAFRSSGCRSQRSRSRASSSPQQLLHARMIILRFQKRYYPRPGMPISGAEGVRVPSGELDDLREAVRDFLTANSPSETVRELMATDTGHDAATWRKMARELGMHGIAVPE